MIAPWTTRDGDEYFKGEEISLETLLYFDGTYRIGITCPDFHRVMAGIEKPKLMLFGEECPVTVEPIVEIVIEGGEIAAVRDFRSITLVPR